MDEPTQVQTEGQQDQARAVSHLGRPSLPGYELERLVGQGAFGEVWSAIQLRTGQRVAVKLLKRNQASDWSRFRAELDRLGDVAEHPYVVSLLDADLDFDPAYLVMPLLPHSLTGQDDPGQARILEWIEQMALALRYMHDKGILHCDFKPSNVLLDDELRVRIADFGQALRREDQHRAYGTLGFMAPEQAGLGSERPGSQPGVAWDVYGWGATAYYLLSGGCSPRLRPEDLALLSTLTVKERLESYPARLAAGRLLPLNVDGDLAAIIYSCLELDPQRRPRSLDQVLEDLQRRRSGDPLLCRRPWSLGYRARKLLARPLVALTLAFGLMGLGGTWLAFDRQAAQLDQLKNARGQIAERAGFFDEACLWWASMRKPDAFGQLRVSRYPTPLLALSHSFSANGLIFSPDGRHLLATGLDQPSVMLDSGTGQKLYSLPVQLNASDAAFSPDGRRIWIGWERWNSRVWDVSDGRAVTPILGDADDQPQPPTEVCFARKGGFSPDSRWLVCREGQGKMRVYEVEGGKPISPSLAAAGGAVFGSTGKYLLTDDSLWRMPSTRLPMPADCSAWSPGRAVFSRPGQLTVTDLVTGKVIRSLAADTDERTFLLSPDGQWLLGTRSDRPSLLWNLESTRAPVELPDVGYAEPRFSDDSSHLAWQADGQVTVWRPGQRQALAQFRLPLRGGASHLDLSPDGHRLVGFDDQICQATSSTGVPLTPPLPCSGVAAFSPDGRRLAVASDCIRIFGLDELRLDHGQECFLNSVFSPDGRKLATVSEAGQLRLWDTSGKLLWRKSLPGSGGPLCFRPDGRGLAVLSQGKIQVFDDRGRAQVTIPVTGERDLEFSPDGRYVLLRQEGHSGVWDSRSGAPLAGPLKTLAIHDNWLVTTPVEGTSSLWNLSGVKPLSMRISQFGLSRDKLAGSDGRQVQVWHLPDLQPLTPSLECEDVRQLAFLPGEQQLLVRTREDVRLLELSSASWVAGAFPGAINPRLSNDRRWVYTEEPHGLQIFSSDGKKAGELLAISGRVLASAFTPDSSRLLAVCSDGLVRTWSVPGGKPGTPIRVGEVGYGPIQFSSDGRFFAIGGGLWHLATGTPWLQAGGYKLDFSPDGGLLSSLDRDGNLRLLPLQVAVGGASVEKITGRRLLPDGEAIWLTRQQWLSLPSQQ